MKIVVIGVSLKPGKRSLSMVKKLLKQDFEVYALGRRTGEIDGLKVHTGTPYIERVNTVIMYLKPEYQKPYYDYIVNEIKPWRIIFNRNTVNEHLMELCLEADIKVVEDCSLVMLARDQI